MTTALPLASYWPAQIFLVKSLLQLMVSSGSPNTGTLALLQEQEESEECAPNTITYSSLISACERGGQFDRALQWFERMQQSGVKADAITFR